MKLPALPRHPRRLGFILFNLVVLALAVAWLGSAPEGGLADLPNFALANVGMVFLLAAWVIAWLAWGVLVLRRWHLRQRRAATVPDVKRNGTASPARTGDP